MLEMYAVSVVKVTTAEGRQVRVQARVCDKRYGGLSFNLGSETQRILCAAKSFSAKPGWKKQMDNGRRIVIPDMRRQVSQANGILDI